MLKKLHKHLRPDNDRENLDDLRSLLKVPQTEKPHDHMPTFQDFIPNFRQQADVLHMPNARFGYNKILVVVDDHTKKMDAEPLKDEDSHVIVKAFEKIYNRGILHQPKMLEFDAGVAFHGEVIDYCESHHIMYRYADTNRHRQQGIVESKNGVFARALFSFLSEKELSNLKEAEELRRNRNKKKVRVKLSTDWYISDHHFRSVINFINEHTKAVVHNTQISDEPIISKDNENLISVGTLVRTTLNYPREIGTGKRLFGDFRATDIRWSREIKPVIWVSLIPGEPPMYRVQGESVMRTRQQLQVMSKPQIDRGFS
jgi:hypothetical protein